MTTLAEQLVGWLLDNGHAYCSGWSDEGSPDTGPRGGSEWGIRLGEIHLTVRGSGYGSAESTLLLETRKHDDQLPERLGGGSGMPVVCEMIRDPALALIVRRRAEQADREMRARLVGWLFHTTDAPAEYEIRREGDWSVAAEADDVLGARLAKVILEQEGEGRLVVMPSPARLRRRAMELLASSCPGLPGRMPCARELVDGGRYCRECQAEFESLQADVERAARAVMEYGG